MNKSISVIVPFYKGEIFYPSLLNSIKNAVVNCGVNTINFELITIIDSIDSDYDIVNNMVLNCFLGLENVSMITIKNEKNIGVAGSRNKAISISKGDYLHIIDQDDSIAETFYNESIKLLENHNFILNNGKVYYEDVKYNTHKLYYFTPKLTITSLLKNDFIRSPGQVIFLKKLLKDKFFPEPISYKGADDRFFWLRMFLENKNVIKPYYLKNVNYIANIHSDNFSGDRINMKKSILENWSILRKEIDISGSEKLINNDILRVRYALGEELSFDQKIFGAWYNAVYFLEFNKILRFIIKRKLW